MADNSASDGTTPQVLVPAKSDASSILEGAYCLVCTCCCAYNVQVNISLLLSQKWLPWSPPRLL